MDTFPRTTISDPLVARSVQSILSNQVVNGAIVASPDFAQYDFCWLRDGSFSSYALDMAGEHTASEEYHTWVNSAVTRISSVIDRVTEIRESGGSPDAATMPPARFALDGSTVVDDWPNFQIDGYGTWLWSLGRHLDLRGTLGLPSKYRASVERVARYLSAFAFSSCYDIWEESGDDLHTSTLASVYAGLVAAGRLLDRSEFLGLSEGVRSRISEDGRRHGHFVKSSTNHDVDGSLLWLGVPFDVFDVRDELLVRTVSLIEERLDLGGGIRRYPADVYFGSGAWPVLTASLGSHLVAVGDVERARQRREWIASRFDDAGRLGEQFGGDVRDPENFRAWVSRWGQPAQDLTWSHAMFVILSLELEDAEPGPVGVVGGGSAAALLDVEGSE